MAYATVANMEEHFGAQQVLIASDRDGRGTLNQSVILAALEKASNEIDSYLGERYELPLTAVPEVLVSKCCEIAMYRMSPDHGALTEEKRVRYEDAIKWLKDVVAGKAGLGTTTSEGDETDVPEVSDETTTRQFTRSKMGSLM